MTSEMFDSIDPSQIPPDVDDAGYVDGRWQTFQLLHGPHNLSIAVFASDDADALDIEPGDATNAQAPGWVKRELSLGHWRPCCYTSVSNGASLLAVLAGAGISRSQIRLWTAHYTYRPHLCDQSCGLPAGVTADATQWTDHSGGKNLDESTVADNFFDTPPPVAPPPAPPVQLGDTVQALPISFTTNADGWMAFNVNLPGGATRTDIIAVPIDWASAYDPQGWKSASASVDFSLNEPGVARIVAKGDPESFFTGRVIVAPPTPAP